jgi:acyl transferase domain-containing protein
VPSDRWNTDAYYDPDPEKMGKIQTDHGGFIEDMAKFDASFFQVGPREAEVMDPQQRNILEVSCHFLSGEMVID